MERRPSTDLNEPQSIQVYKISETIVSTLTAGAHRVNDLSAFFIKSGISDALYRIGPKVPSGLISVQAQREIEEGTLNKKKLTKEHPISRNKTALDIILYFDYNENKLNQKQLVKGVASIYANGCLVHFVTKDENTKLKGYQQDHTLTPEQCYQLAGIELVPFVQKPKLVLEYAGQYFSTKKELSESLNITKYQINKMIAQGAISILDQIEETNLK